MLSWTQLRNPSSRLNPFINWFKSRPDRKLRPTFKPALKTDQSSSVVVGPDKRQPKTAAGKAPRLNSEVFFDSSLWYLFYSGSSGTVVGRTAKLGL